MRINDERICEILKRHDPRGLELLFDNYYRPFVLWADTFLGNVAASEDLVQDFFVMFWEKKLFSRLTSSNLKGYIFTSVKNLALNQLQKRDPLVNAQGIARIQIKWLEPEDITEQMLRDIEAEIEKLPPRTRQVLKAVYIDGMKYSEVAHRLEISIATVKTLLVNALKRLRAIFARYF